MLFICRNHKNPVFNSVTTLFSTNTHVLVWYRAWNYIPSDCVAVVLEMHVLVESMHLCCLVFPPRHSVVRKCSSYIFPAIVSVTKQGVKSAWLPRTFSHHLNSCMHLPNLDYACQNLISLVTSLIVRIWRVSSCLHYELLVCQL